MRIILSRKGFDSASGGVPSPIFPDGRVLSLPIPDNGSPIQFDDITWYGYDVGSIVSDLTEGAVPGFHGAHLDPDLNPRSLPRHTAWRPLLGQVKAAQGHLRNHGVRHGDIFLFFGLFREIVWSDSQLRFDVHALPRHVIWGWLQIDMALAVDDCHRGDLEWALYHPHFHRKPDRTNTIYVAKEHLSIPGRTESSVRGAGVFEYYSPALQLTKPGSKKTALWQLPHWFHPDGEKTPLTYHASPRRWKRENGHVLLETVGRGQEFILDCSCYPEAIGWISHLLDCAAISR